MAVSRRTLMGALGGAALGASVEIGCADKTVSQTAPAIAPDPSLKQLNLVCHGMMLFWYDKSEPDYFKILIPQPPSMNATGGGTHYHHAIAFSEYRTGFRNKLAMLDYPQDDVAKYQLGFYELILEGAPSVFQRSKSNYWPKAGTYPDKTKDVVLYDESQKYALKPAVKLEDPSHKPDLSDPIWFLIKVPYPTNVYSYRVMDLKGKPPYDPSKGTAKACGINPATMGGVHLFHYEGLPQRPALRYHKYSSSPIDTLLGPTGLPGYQNFHLYSQPMFQGDYGSPSELAMHLKAFNGMMVDGGGSPMDLTSNLLYPAAASPSTTPIDLQLAPEDLDDLVELIGGPPSATLEEQKAALARAKGPRTAEPVECLQGWGT